MRIIEVTVIYFSIGAAFGTHRLLLDHISGTYRFFPAVAATLFWPIHSLLKIVYSVPSGRTINGCEPGSQLDSTLECQVGRKQLEFDDLLRDCFSGSILYAYRDMLARYTGISLTISNFDQFFKYELLFVDSKPVKDVQHACISRRNRTKLLRHQTAVRREFIRMLFKMLTAADNPDIVGAKAVGLVTVIGDLEAIKEVNAVLNNVLQNRRAVPVQKMENQTWIPQQQ